MELFRLQLFCCCCNLRTGSLVIGTLGWLMTLIQIFYLTSPLKEERHKYENTESDIAAEIAYSVVTLLVCVCMIYGVYKDDKRFILPWLVLKCFECIAWTIITFIIFIIFFFVEEQILMIFVFFIIVLFSTLNWYFWICVWNLYMELTEDKLTTVIPRQEVKSDTNYCPIEAV